MRKILAPLLAAATLAATATATATAAAATALDDYLRLQLGSWTSESQAALDQRYGTAVWHLAEIWRDPASAERWIYAESWMKGAGQPYMQRVTQLTLQPDGSILARRYAIPEPARFVGAWREPERFTALAPAELEELAGCEVTLVRAGRDRFEGGTQAARCANGYKGAAYAVSQSLLTPTEMTNWDRGFAADGELRWGPATGGYRFRRVDEVNACAKPVRLLVFGEIDDRGAFAGYARALAASGLYARFGGEYEAITPAAAVLEGDPPPKRGVVISRWPCLEAVQAFWDSPEYREIVKLREGNSRFEVLVLPTPPVPAPTRP